MMEQRMSEPTHLTFAVDSENARDGFIAAVDQLLAAQVPAPKLIVDLEGETLTPEVVATMVAGLRRLREVGGAIAVEPRTQPLRDALALHGLDRVFALPLDPETAPRSGRRRWLPRVAVAALAVLVSLAGAWPANAALSNDTDSADPGAVVARVIERNPNLTSFQGRLHVDIRLTSFPFIREHLDATTYYKRPSNYEVIFDKVPGYAHGFEKLYTDVGDPSSWEKRFVITSGGYAMFGKQRDVVLYLVQRVRGMIDHETVLVDPATWTIAQIRYDYYNGGSITMSQTFRDVGGYLLLTSQRADIRIPHVHAVAYGTYSDYQTNVAVNDAVFARNN
jgi:hypothetical protein